MLERILKRTIPEQLNAFPKLTSGKEPYRFSSWDLDEATGEPILRYWFWSRDQARKYRKRIFIYEVEGLLKNVAGTGEITRRDFKKYCPKTDRDGECGFAVVIAILEYFGIVDKSARGVYSIVDHGKAQEIVEC